MKPSRSCETDDDKVRYLPLGQRPGPYPPGYGSAAEGCTGNRLVRVVVTSQEKDHGLPMADPARLPERRRTARNVKTFRSLHTDELPVGGREGPDLRIRTNILAAELLESGHHGRPMLGAPHHASRMALGPQGQVGFHAEVRCQVEFLVDHADAYRASSERVCRRIHDVVNQQASGVGSNRA